jgi:hypothetical protein
VVEKPQQRVNENYSVLIRRLDAFLVHDTSRRRCEIPNTTFLRAMHVVREREKRITRTCYTVELSRVVRTLLGTERRRDLLEQAVPLLFLAALENLASDKEVDRVRFFGALDSFLEWERKNARVVAQPPIISLGARKSRAVDTRLLTCAQSDYRAAIGIRHAV